MGSDGSQLQIPRVDFRGLSPSSPAGERWGAACEQVMAALESFGCFEAVYDAVSPEIKDELFFRSMPELFALPTATKMANLSTGLPYSGYIGQIPGLAYESLRVGEAYIRENVEEFTSLMWPEGNPSFSNAIWTYAKHVRELEQMVERMILQSMGVEKYYDSHIESLEYGLRLSEYGVPFDQESKVALNSHLDSNTITIVCQYQIDGLEVQTRDGEWIHVVSQPNSFNVMVGESLGAWSNGRLQAPHHRVRVTGNETRYSIIFGSRPGDDAVVEVPKEQVDEEHPLRFRPYKYGDYMQYRFATEEGKNAKEPLQAFAGVGEKVA
ncbi:putative inactive 2-oxoglutarate-dependent dioxygenase AOP2 [Canna indica]|uniref:2-oxoglutarate-dependent dioxygenase DAO n=1 Tax=Canna indica TaxID=4628 RepID=A0AAQ3JLE6_9LILI|nr:putative inactive 2-oxoglutarate-dependent dioxygenase AOP2 [Canna indica]